MIDKKDVEKLLLLSRIDVADSEKNSLLIDIKKILEYFGELEKTLLTKPQDNNENGLILKNIMREDKNPHDSGIHSEELLAEAPRREGNYFAVKKIL